MHRRASVTRPPRRTSGTRSGTARLCTVHEQLGVAVGGVSRIADRTIAKRDPGVRVEASLTASDTDDEARVVAVLPEHRVQNERAREARARPGPAPARHPAPHAVSERAWGMPYALHGGPAVAEPEDRREGEPAKRDREHHSRRERQHPLAQPGHSFTTSAMSSSDASASSKPVMAPAAASTSTS